MANDDPSVPGFDGCPWPVDSGCFDEGWEALSDEVKERSIALASATLRRLTGYRVGGCPVTVRPCSRDCWDTFYPIWFAGPAFYPWINVQGDWVNSVCCGNNCQPGCAIDLPAPATQVTEVKINGDVISSSDYRLDGSQLVWTGGGDCPFPIHQDMTLADTEDGTFSITYLNSYPVDGLGAYAAGVLAYEFAQACGDGDCRLPTNVTNIVRQGVSYEVTTGSFPSGMTGIREVDAYIAVWNPRNLRQNSSVYSPSRPRMRVNG